MVKFKNETDALISFQHPDEHDRPKWYHVGPKEEVEVPDEQTWRALAHGLAEVKGSPVEVEAKVEVKPKKPK